MTLIEQAEEFRKQGIALLLQERDNINGKLTQFGYQNGELETKSRKQITCGKCKTVGHTARTCPTLSGTI